MVWMAVAAVLVCVNLVSCSKDDQEKEIVKKLSKFTVENSSGRVEMTFNYDLEGRLQGAEQINYDGSNVTTNVYEFTWGENTIDFVMTKVEAEDWVENTTLTLENGLAKLQSEDYLFGVESTFAYDTLGRLVKTTRAYYDLTLGWEDNKLTSIKNANFMLGYNQSFEYESVSSLKGHNPLLPYRVGAGILFVAHPELAGLLTNQFSNETMMSLSNKGLYAVGEILDIDGDCGGFNLQWAWSSATAAAEDILREKQ